MTRNREQLMDDKQEHHRPRDQAWCHGNRQRFDRSAYHDAAPPRQANFTLLRPGAVSGHWVTSVGSIETNESVDPRSRMRNKIRTESLADTWNFHGGRSRAQFQSRQPRYPGRSCSLRRGVGRGGFDLGRSVLRADSTIEISCRGHETKDQEAAASTRTRQSGDRSTRSDSLAVNSALGFIEGCVPGSCDPTWPDWLPRHTSSAEIREAFHPAILTAGRCRREE